MSSEPPANPAALPPAEKVKQFPAAPGVYIMKDAQGVVLYVGKAKNLRNRAGHYFTKAAVEDPRTSDLVPLIADIDYLAADSEVDALLMEARLVKDIQPRFNVELKDDKTFPYLQIRIREDFPRVEFTRQPRRRGVRLYGPFTSPRTLRHAIRVLQRIFQFRTCSLDIDADDSRWRWFRPCLLHSIRQCTAPCNFRVTKEEYRKQIRALRMVLEGKKDRLIREMEREMEEASKALLFEKAARLRDDIAALQSLGPARQRRARCAAGSVSHRSEEGSRRTAQGTRPTANAAHHRRRGHRPPRRQRHRGILGELHRRFAVQTGLSPLSHQIGARH